MAWNEPGGDKKKDPWGGGGNDSPPDLDELARKMRERMNKFFGGKGGGSGKKGVGIPLNFGLIAIVAVLAWVLSGIYIIQPAERGVVLRLGEFNTITGPGPHWMMRGIETVDKVDVDNLRTVSHRAKMLTRDENIVQVEVAVQYQVRDAKEYLFQVRDPDYTLQEATESALREVIGGISMDEFLSGGRGAIVQQTKVLTQAILDKYKAGLILTSVNLQDPQPPEEVQGAFEDAIKAQEDEVRYKNQAQAYALDILPKARGDATRMREAAMAYRDQVVAGAEGEASRFTQTRVEYEKAPEITRKRLYLETMEYVLANTSKVIMQVKDGNNLMYIPLDKLMENRGAAPRAPAEDVQINATPTPSGDGPRRRTSSREGGTR
ncbi:MAG: FtsH protease activity modulator HflK [Gammaproteobacteria bacterium]|nr:MAG: FtsH protease activity modulator HflK [Gammaproteobacteria bacterium]